MPGARLEQVDGLGSTLEVVVGRDALKVRAVVVVTPRATPSKPPVTAGDDACS